MAITTFINKVTLVLLNIRYVKFHHQRGALDFAKFLGRKPVMDDVIRNIL